MKHTSRKKMTLDGLARSMQRQFLDARKEVFEMRSTILNEMRVIIEGMREHNRKVLESNDKLVTRFDALLKEEAAHTILHKRGGDRLDNHEKRIARLETRA